MCVQNCQEFLHRWRLWIKPLLIFLYALFVIILVPFLIVNSVKDGFKRKDQLILIGGLLVLTALPISIWHITQHCFYYTKPALQKHIIRILWMVPIYALNAWLGLLFPAHSIYMDSIRECYEAYVIYNFMMYLLNYLNLEMDLEATLELKPPIKHVFPLCYMKSWQGSEFVHNCKHGILQYTVVRPLTTIISIFCRIGSVYGDGEFKVNVAYPYIIAVNNITQFVAMYCLILFYKANKVELRPMKPLPKFLCIKAVVFFSFFQGVIINILVYYGYFSNIFGDNEPDDYQNKASKLQNFLICIEMFIAAIAHHYSFPHDPFHINIPNHYGNSSWYNAFLAMLDVRDVHQDVFEHFGVVGSSLSRHLRGRSQYDRMTRGTESDYLIQSNSVPSTCYQSDIIINDIDNNLQSISNKTILQNKNQHYGTCLIDNNLQQQNKNDGITIIQQIKKDYSPKHGLPKAKNVFNYNNSLSIQSPSQDNTNTDNITSSENTTNSSSEQMLKDDSLCYDGAVGGSLNINLTGRMIKSDSNNSDWLSTPTDIDGIGLDVKGIENDRITYRDPKV